MRTARVQSASAAQSALTLWSSRILKNSSRVMNENDAAMPDVAKESARPLRASVYIATCAGLTVRELEPPVPMGLGSVNNRVRGTSERGRDAEASCSTTAPHAAV